MKNTIRKRTAILFWVLLFATGSILSGCSSKNVEDEELRCPTTKEVEFTEDDWESDEEEELYEAMVEEASPLPEDVLEVLGYTGAEPLSAEGARAVNLTALRWYQMLEQDDNVVVSPYGLSIMLSMIGAMTGEDSADHPAGSTLREQVKELFGVTDLEGWYDALKQHSAYLSGRGIMSSYNLLALRENENFITQNLEEMKRRMVSYFDGEYRTLTEDCTKDTNSMNDWLARLTENMLTDVFREDMLSQSIMLLANVVYFEGRWSNVFDEENTKKETFYGLESAETVDIMHQNVVGVRYYEGNGMRALTLPYQEGGQMDVIIPADSSKRILDIFGKLTVEEQLDFIDRIYENDEMVEVTDLALPKFSYDFSDEELMEQCMQLGVDSCFDPKAEDFSWIYNGSLYLNKMMQAARIEVDEKGTRASAVTISGFSGSGMPPAYPEIEFRVDHPFLFLIRDSRTGTILFMGTVTQLED